MARRLALLCVLLLLPSLAWAQFTIPNSNATGINPNQSLWMQADVDALVAGIKGTGVVSGCAVTWSSGNTFNVSAGSVKINGSTVSVSSTTVTLLQANGARHRIDLVVVDSGGTVSAVQGTVSLTPTAPALPTSKVLLASVFVPAASLTLSAARVVDKRVFIGTGGGGGGTTEPGAILLSDYGAVCDGSTDDTDAIQAAFDAATSAVTAFVLWPARACKVTETVTLGSTTEGTTTFLGIRGVSAAQSQLLWGGATDGTALRLARTKYTEVSNFGVRNTVSAGTTIGIEQGGNTASDGGTQALAQTWTNVLVTGFGTGIQAGGHNGASSEFVYHNLELDNNGRGWYSIDFNTLDHVFIELLCGGNAICIDSGASSNFTVYGGSASNSSTADFYIQQAGTFLISGFRSESANRVLRATTGTVRLDSVLAVSPSNADKIAIDGTYSTLSVVNSLLDGKVSLTNAHGGVSIAHSKVFGDTTIPFFTTTTTQVGLPYSVQNVTFHDPAASVADFLYADSVGNIFSSDNGTTYSPNSTQPIDYPVSRVTRSATLGDAYTLNRVKMLAQGSDVAGKNLRAQIVFGSSATAAVAFVRNVTVSIDTPTLIATSGRFYPSDAGKKVVMVGIGGGGTDVTRFIRAYIDSTHVVVAPISSAMQCCSSQTGVTATIGEDEPDANYLLHLGCSAQETFSWSSKATTGFTLTSSNSGSTATCDVVIVR